MSYESPIEIFEETVSRQYNKTLEEAVMNEVKRIGVYVDKHELLRALQYDRDQYDRGYHDGLNASKWISTEDRLPEEWEEVLYWYDCNNHNKGFLVGYYEKSENHFTVGCDDDYAMKLEYVKAWMPLPEPYKGSE